jgi:hypothetical protein
MMLLPVTRQTIAWQREPLVRIRLVSRSVATERWHQAAALARLETARLVQGSALATALVD